MGTRHGVSVASWEGVMEEGFWWVLLLEPEADSMGPIGGSETPSMTLQENPDVPSCDCTFHKSPERMVPLLIAQHRPGFRWGN